MTEFAVLSHSHAVLPSAITSVSLSGPGTASRKCRGPEYQTLTVCDPVSREAIEVGFAVPGRLGRPSEVVSTTVPVSGGVDRVRDLGQELRRGPRRQPGRRLGDGDQRAGRSPRR